MTLKEALRRFRATAAYTSVRAAVETPGGVFAVREAAGSVPSFVLAGLAGDRAAPLLVALTADEDAALYLLADLGNVAPDVPALYLPPTGVHPYDPEQVDDAKAVVARAEALQALRDGFAGVLVASVEAFAEKVAAPRALDAAATRVATGETLDLGAFLERLEGQSFRRVEFVEEPGELAVRGGLVDVFPFVGEYPLRIELFGDEVDSIREFDPATQRSVSRLETARLLPRLDVEHGRADTESVFAYLPAGTLFATFDEARLLAAVDDVYTRAEQAYAARPDGATDEAPPDARFLRRADVEVTFEGHRRLAFGSFAPRGVPALALDTAPQPPVGGKMDVLRRVLTDDAGRGLTVTILCDTAGQRARLGELLDEDLEKGRVALAAATLHEGFVCAEAGFALYTDHGLFNRYHRPATNRGRRKTGGLSLRDLTGLQPGDFVVHVDHGVGKFAGMEHIEVRGKEQEAVRLIFAGGDVLYVNVNALYKLHKFTGQEGHQPALTKLGSGAWEKAKARTKKRVKDIARDLIALYARRQASAGHAFSRDTLWQREMEAAFEYEDTPDQAAAAEAVKEDMEQATPMDRLVQGDVGFGKTEVAVRAAFKAVQDGKQVAVLVPTTILAAQHFETFTRRLKGYPVRVEQLSRFRTPQEQKETLARLKKGEVDVVIGTQRLASKDVAFKDLGLLVIDEEQRFGVAVKERLRQMRAEVDTLTLTATPIPRTLQFSLMGARDLSIIQTPPPNRQPIATEIHTFSQDLIRDAILYETSRGGQVFFVHNRVQTIEEMAATVQAIVPGIRVGVGHGQMKPEELETVMMAFIEGRYDVLVSTNIVESGLDVSNANTIVINRADRFGLAELHQLRGRVGRSDRKAHCYLLVPSIQGLTREARQRLQAVEEFADLGSGFNIAMRDLDIRGAGALLGAEQSGFVAEIGFETYHAILEEAVEELRRDEFAHVFKDAPAPKAGETTLDIEEDAFLPPAYVANNVERLNLYRRIAEAEGTDDLNALRAELADRFGPLPDEVDHLLVGAELRLLGGRLRLARVQYKNERLWLDTPEPDADPYFYDHVFQPFLARLEASGRRYALKDVGKKLRVIVQAVPALTAARDTLARLVEADVVPA